MVEISLEELVGEVKKGEILVKDKAFWKILNKHLPEGITKIKPKILQTRNLLKALDIRFSNLLNITKLKESAIKVLEAEEKNCKFEQDIFNPNVFLVYSKSKPFDKFICTLCNNYKNDILYFEKGIEYKAKILDDYLQYLNEKLQKHSNNKGNLKELVNKFSNTKKLLLIYSNPKLYSSPDMFSPPAEKKPYVLQLELTQGCDWNACTFCSGYQGMPYKERTYTEFLAHYKNVKRAFGSNIKHIERVFVGGGNTLSVEEKTLSKVLKLLKKELSPKRIAIYGNTKAIINKGKGGLWKLKWDGLNLIYWGVESGSNSVLEYINKGCTLDETILAGDIVKSTDIDLSIMIIPGLGGKKFNESHIEETVKILNKIRPRFITFMGINPAPSTIYAKRIEKERDNRPLTNKEIVQQLKSILEGIPAYGAGVGMFDSSVDKVGNNPVSFNVRFDSDGKKEALKVCEDYLNQEDIVYKKS